MKKSLLLITVTAMTLLGCNSQPTPSSHYYILNQQLSQEANTQISPVKDIKLTLPEYLKQPNLIMQLSPHELSYAYYHMWAENLHEAIIKSMQHDLKNEANVLITEQPNTPLEQVNLMLSINHFYATIDSKVVLEGHYTLINKAQTHALSPQYAFSYTSEIEENGYPHSVAKMRTLLEHLSRDIFENYQKIPVSSATP